MSWKIEVNTHSDPPDSWAGNALRFETQQEAVWYGNDLYARWTSVKQIRQVESDEAATHKWDRANHRCESLATAPPAPVEINRLKKGAQFKTHDGDPGTIEDNKLGVMRLAKIDGELGTIYMDRLKMALVDGAWRPVVLSQGQQRQMRNIKEAMDKFR